ncbi:hypothetical protein ABH920_003368 [Catenulispora sp. EB89]
MATSLKTWQQHLPHIAHIKNLGWILAAVAFCLIMGRIRGGPFR